MIDATSSMRIDIEKARDSVHNIMKNDSITKRMRVCLYRDHCDENFLSPFGGKGGRNFTSDLNSIKNWLDNNS